MSDLELLSAQPGRRPLAAAVTLCSALGVALVVGACGAPEDPAVAEGRALYEASCETCHGAGGLGDGPMASSLPVPPVSLIEHVAHHSSDEMYLLITRGIPPAMPPHTLTEEQVANVVEFLWTLVPDDQVEALREMQRQIEEMGAPAGGMPGMQMDHSAMPGMQTDSTVGSTPDGR